jgi:hypothetical protein
MGKLIKNHWARLIILTASVYQIAASLEGFFWPKVFWDFMTKNLDGAVKPFPTLQVLNLIFGLLGLAWEWPLKFIADTGFHRSIEARLVIYPVSALAAVLLYQGTNAALYYVIGMAVFFWAFYEGEVCHDNTHLPIYEMVKLTCFHSLFVQNHGRYRSDNLCQGRSENL